MVHLSGYFVVRDDRLALEDRVDWAALALKNQSVGPSEWGLISH